MQAFEASEATSFVDANNPVAGFATSEEAELARWRWVVRHVLFDIDDNHCEAAFQELWHHFARPQAWRVLPDAAATLKRLGHAGWRLGVASNFDARLEDIVRGLNELESIDRVLVSSQIGWRKPAPEFYRQVIKEIGGVPGEIWWVGDRTDHDFDGPIAAGMRALVLDATAALDDPCRLRTLLDLPTRLNASLKRR
jgi:putative hydrolase of the HAD superfamily